MLLTLVVNTAANQLLTSLNNSQVLNPLSIPFFAGDSGLILQIYRMVPTGIQNPSQFNFSNPGTVGIAYQAYLDNGVSPYLANGAANPDYVIYTQCVNFLTDDNNSFFFGAFPMNTAGVLGLFSETATMATATLRLGVLEGGETDTDFYATVNILPGITSAVGPLPAGLTPLSQQGADQRYVRIVGPAGAGFQLTTPNGLKLWVSAKDNLTAGGAPDGTASLNASQI